MNVFVSNAFRKTAGSLDDQSGFMDRDMNPGGIGQGKMPSVVDSDEEILKKWNLRKKRRSKMRPQEDDQGIVRVYQLGLELPMTKKEEARALINL